MNRRQFLFSGSAFAGLSALPAFAESPRDIRAVLLHLGLDQWGDWLGPDEQPDPTVKYTDDHVSFDETVWRETVDYARAKGINTVVMDIGEFLAYPSHPELAVKGSWSAAVLRLFEALDRAGFEQVPCASNWVSPEMKKAGRTDNSSCMGELVRFCREHVSAANLKGFMMASWTNCSNPGSQKFNMAGIDQLAAAV